LLRLAYMWLRERAKRSCIAFYRGYGRERERTSPSLPTRWSAPDRGCVQTPFERPRPAELNALANVRDDEEEGLVPYVLIAAISRCVPRTCIARFRL